MTFTVCWSHLRTSEIPVSQKILVTSCQSCQAGMNESIQWIALHRIDTGNILSLLEIQYTTTTEDISWLSALHLPWQCLRKRTAWHRAGCPVGITEAEKEQGTLSASVR